MHFKPNLPPFSNIYFPMFIHRVIVEAKNRDVNGNWRKRLDIFLRDHDQPTYGFELVVEANKKNFNEHLDRASYYSNLHGCSTYITN
jgi:hypothetical protein